MPSSRNRSEYIRIVNLEDEGGESLDCWTWIKWKYSENSMFFNAILIVCLAITFVSILLAKLIEDNEYVRPTVDPFNISTTPFPTLENDDNYVNARTFGEFLEHLYGKNG